MTGWTEEDIRRQFQRARKNGWLQTFKNAAAKYGFPAEVLMAIASRETNMRNIVGDGGHGYGIMQIDDRSFPEWCHSGLWKDASAGIQKGALLLQSKRETIQKGQGKRLNVGGNSFTGKRNLSKGELLRTAVAAYNAGLWSYYDLSRTGNPDLHTTGRNYSTDTLCRAQAFRKLIGR